MKKEAEFVRAQVRALAHTLAYEEEVGHRFKNWYERKVQHDKLLNRLNRLEKKV